MPCSSLIHTCSDFLGVEYNPQTYLDGRFFPICWTPSSLDALLWSAPLAGYMNNMACFSTFFGGTQNKPCVWQAIRVVNHGIILGFCFCQQHSHYWGPSPKSKRGAASETQGTLSLLQLVMMWRSALCPWWGRQTSHSCFFRTPLAHRRKPNKMINVKT